MFFGEALLLALGASPVMIEVGRLVGWLEFFRDGPGNFGSFERFEMMGFLHILHSVCVCLCEVLYVFDLCLYKAVKEIPMWKIGGA